MEDFEIEVYESYEEALRNGCKVGHIVFDTEKNGYRSVCGSIDGLENEQLIFIVLCIISFASGWALYNYLYV